MLPPPRPIPPLIQRPIDWIAAAFRLRSGWGPGQLERDITPVLDVAQGGVGLGSWISAAASSGVGNALVFTLAADKTVTRLVQCDINCAAIGGQTIQVITQQPATGNTLLYHIYEIVPAILSGVYPWATIARGQAWIIVPPGYDFFVSVSASAGIQNTVHYRRLEVPAGTKAW